MRRLGLWFASLLMLTGFAVAASATPVFAANTDVLKKPVKAAKPATLPTCDNVSTTKNPLTGADGMLIRVTHFIALIAGVTAVIIIIISGIQYITSGGDTQKAVGARNALIGALVGLVIIGLADVIIVAIIRGFL